MLDYLTTATPFKDQYVFRSQDEKVLGTSLLLHLKKDLGLETNGYSIDFDEHGNVVYSHLKHPFEDLPSGYSTMAIKCYDESHYGVPTFVMKGSPAKLLQGHNVYGGDSIKQAWIEMHGLLALAYPQLMNYLDIPNTEARRLDSTYSAWVDHNNLVDKIINYFSDIGNGQRQPRRGDLTYGATCYWGGRSSRLIRAKLYGKQQELQAQFIKLKKRADKGCSISAKQVQVIKQLNLIEFSSGQLRFEATTLHEKLTRLGIPTNIFKLIEHQERNPSLLQDLWHLTFDPIFEAIKGETMHHLDDDALLDKFRSKLFTVTKKGHKRYTKANNAFNFYCQIRQFGLEEVRKRYQHKPNSRQVSSTFYDNISVLTTKMGFSKAHLANLGKKQAGMVIPMIKLVNVDFSKQAPAGFVPPVSQFYQANDEKQAA